MCYSTQSSIISWLISVTIGLYLWQRNKKYDRWNAGFIWVFSAVQLWEAGIWSSQDSEIFVKLIALTLVLQPLVQTIGAWDATGRNSMLLTVLIGVYSVIVLYTLYRVFTEQFWSTIGPNGHLVWHTDGGQVVNGHIKVVGLLYLVGLFLGLFYGLPSTLPLISIGVLTIIWSLNRVSTQEFASYWCYVAIAYSITSIFVN